MESNTLQNGREVGGFGTGRAIGLPGMQVDERDAQLVGSVHLLHDFMRVNRGRWGLPFSVESFPSA